MRLFLAVFAFFYFSAAHAGSSIESPYLFLVEKDGVTSHLFGSMHVGISLQEMPRVVTDAVKNAKVFVTETYRSPSEAATPPSKPEPKPALKPMTIEMLHLRGISQEYLKVASAGTLCFSYIYWEAVLNDLFLDSQLTSFAEKLALPIQALDDRSDLQEINASSDSCDVDSMVTSISPDEARKIMTVAVEKYRAGTMDVPESVAESELTMGLTTRRNLKWIEKLERLHPRRAFVVVGVDHLLGDKGLIKLLQARGFKVSRVAATGLGRNEVK